MPPRASVAAITNELIQELNDIRRQRETAIARLNRREAEVLTRLSALRNVPLPGIVVDNEENEEISSSGSSFTSIPDDLPELEDTATAATLADIDVEVETVLEPIRSPRDLREGDKVRIKNRVYGFGGTVTERNRLATVIKVHRVFVSVRTEAGDFTRRTVANLEKVVYAQRDQVDV